MTLVDDRGRLGGRLNLVDAIAALIILVLIPVAYGSYLLFRTPPATLTSIEPTKLLQGRNLRIVVNGKNLRPFMRVSFNVQQGRTFLLGNTKYAEIDLPDLDPGTYDIVLYDYMQEIDRLPKALTILPLAQKPTVQMEVAGAFVGLADAAVKLMRPGTRFSSPGADAVAVAEVLSVAGAAPAHLRIRSGDDTFDVPIEGASELRATLRVSCYVTTDPDGVFRCLMSGPQQPAPIAPDSNLTLPGPQGWVTFQIREVHGAGWLPPAAKTPASK